MSEQNEQTGSQTSNGHTFIGRKPTNKFGAMLREKGFTRITLGKRLKVAGPTVGYWSTNGVPESRLAQVAKVLGVDPSTIPVQVRAQENEVKHGTRVAAKKPKRASKKANKGSRGTKFGDMLRENGYTVATFAKKMKVKNITVQNWSSQGLPRKHVNKVATVLGVKPSSIPVFVDPRWGGDAESSKQPVAAKPNTRPLTVGELLRACENRYINARDHLDTERVRLEVGYKQTLEELSGKMQKAEEEYRADKVALDKELASLNAEYATERGELVAVLAKEVEAMKAVVDQYSIPTATPVSQQPVNEPVHEPVQFGQPAQHSTSGDGASADGQIRLF